jgi:hypothetical protein
MVGSRAADGKLSPVQAGYQGEVTLDVATNRVLRLKASADAIPKESDVTQSSVEVDYSFIDVGGKSYLLPSRSVALMEREYRTIGNTVNFVDYKKLEADSSISFKE